jgi:hypothetical protein
MKPRNQAIASQSDVTDAGTSVEQSATESTKQAEAIDVLAIDEHAGKPGSYLFDPATGKRSKAD